ncbi:MAG: histidine kinase N-terminal 7TM domain-containing protein, partial [Acutalibacteraceae bacterium]
MKKTHKTPLAAVTVSAAVIIAYIFRIIDKQGIAVQLLGFIRSVIYLTLFIAWGVSLKLRIQQKQVRKYMLAVDMLIVFWVFIRSLKFYIVSSPAAARYIWYLYYLPMLFIPMLAMLSALSIGKPDSYKLPKPSLLLWIIPMVLFALVMTNDLHQLIFTFPSGLTPSMWSDDEYAYNFLFKTVSLWEVGCSVAAFIIMAFKCRVPGSKKFFWLPPVPLALSVLYLALYGSGFHWLSYLFGDTTVVQSLLIAAALEACIQLGLIHSNSRYEELFDASLDCSAQIVDRDFNVKYASRDARPISKDLMHAAEKSPIKLEDGNILHTMPINGGYAVWTEDNSELLALTEELELIKEELEDRGSLLRYEYEHGKRRQELEEQNRLYDLLQSVTQKQIDRIALLVENYRNEERDSAASKAVLAKIAVLCCFIKRRKHLALSAYRDYSIPLSELNVAFGESLRTLELLGVSHSLFTDAEEMLNGSDAAALYDFFEDVTEAGLECLKSLNVRVARINGRL